MFGFIINFFCLSFPFSIERVLFNDSFEGGNDLEFVIYDA